MRKSKGRKLSKEWKYKISEGLKKSGRIYKVSEETKEKISRTLLKGKRIGYISLHNWLRANYGNANHCDNCGIDKIPIENKRYFDWALRRGKEYKKDVRNFVQLCKKCHSKYDRSNYKLII